MAKRPTLQLMVGGRIPVEIEPVVEVNLLELLGVGGFGSAWKAADITTGKEYVLKVIPDVKPDSTLAERVRMEAEVCIPSEYVVPVTGLRQWDPSTFLILFEYFPGKSLDKVLAADFLSGEQKQLILRQMLIGTADAHRHNVIHRDLKPANVLADEAARVRVIDFGISKFKDKNITMSGEVMGTIPYMPLELMVKGSYLADARSDIYALGHIFYELAMGRHFWVQRGWSHGLEDYIAYLNQTPQPTAAIDLSDFHCNFCENAAAVIERMVKVEPVERYGSVDEVLADLGYDRRVSLPPPEDMALRSPVLVVESGTNRGARTVLGLEDGERREFGRAEIAGNDRSISRRHLEFSRSGDRYSVQDLNSKNGTLVRGLALDPAGPAVEIRHTDRIKAGDVFLRFVFLRKD